MQRSCARVAVFPITFLFFSSDMKRFFFLLVFFVRRACFVFIERAGEISQHSWRSTRPITFKVSLLTWLCLLNIVRYLEFYQLPKDRYLLCACCFCLLKNSTLKYRNIRGKKVTVQTKSPQRARRRTCLRNYFLEKESWGKLVSSIKCRPVILPSGMECEVKEFWGYHKGLTQREEQGWCSLSLEC